jgi:CBS domain-containing protein
VTVAQLMRTRVVSIGPEATVAELASLLRAHGISGLPVVDDRGRALGMVSVTDLVWLSDRIRPTAGQLRGGGRWERLDAVKVREIMTPDVFGVSPGASLDELLEFFARTGLHRALVLEDGVVVGIVSMTDLLDLMIDAGGEQSPAVDPLG